MFVTLCRLNYPYPFFFSSSICHCSFPSICHPCELLPPTHMVPLSPQPMRQPCPPSPTRCPNTHSFHFTHFAMRPPAHLSCHSLAFLIHNVRMVYAVAAQVFLSSFISCNISVSAVSAFGHLGSVKIRSVCWSRGSAQP